MSMEVSQEEGAGRPGEVRQASSCFSGSRLALISILVVLNLLAFQLGFTSTVMASPPSASSNPAWSIQSLRGMLSGSASQGDAGKAVELLGGGGGGASGARRAATPPPTRAGVVPTAQTVDALSDELGNALPGTSLEQWKASGPRKMASDAHLVRTMPQGIPPVGAPDYALRCGEFHGGAATTVQAFTDEGRDAWAPTPFSKHAIVTMAAGDGAARMVVALLQSLRDVGTCPGIDIVVMLSGGGHGSEDCRRGRVPDHDSRRCDADRPAAKSIVVSQPYIDAIHALGGQTILIEPVPSATAVIPGGRKAFWGMAFNKLRVYGLVQYESVLWLDSDVFVTRNLDHLLFYPEFTAAFTMDCCNLNASPRPSGGFWVIQPSAQRLKHVLTLVNGPDPLVPLNLEQGDKDWHFGDMAVMMALYVKLRKVPRYYHLFESYDARIAEERIRQWYKPNDPAYPAKWMGYGPDLVLASNNDSTVYASKPEYSGDHQFVVSSADANLADELAFSLDLPSLAGRRWHMLNESYDWLVVECQCAPQRDMGPDLIFSVHFSCLPGHIKKPGHFAHIQEQRAALASPPDDMKPCLQKWYQTWTDAYERGMGKLLHAIWSEEAEQQGG